MDPTRKPIQVVATVKHLATGAERRLELGEWYAVWRKGVSVGSAPDCTIVLEGPGIAPRHALLTRRGHHHYLEEVKGELRIEGELLELEQPEEPCRISGIGDPAAIEVGGYEVRVRSHPT